jgi:gas vesicle protein
MAKKKENVNVVPMRSALTLREDEAAAVAPYVGDGWTPTGRRRQPVTMPLSDEQLVELGEQAACLDGDLRVMRQGKNATSAALNREKKEKEGAMHMLAARLRSKKDELGKELSMSERATYTRQLARVRREFDRWEEERKATIQRLKDDLDAKEKEHGLLSERIERGEGSAMVSVVDLTDFASGTVVSVRVDTRAEVGRRKLQDHERQLPLLDELDAAPAMTLDEYALVVAGRVERAADLYAQRNGMAFDRGLRLVKAMNPDEVDEELPGEESALADGVVSDDEGDDDAE